MDAKAAVALAKKEIGELFADEDIRHLGLEEIEFDEGERAWVVTIGFARPWGAPPGALATLAGAPEPRAYKVVRIDDASGQVLSVRKHSAEVI